jgi:outer membrane protein insertion porin family
METPRKHIDRAVFGILPAIMVCLVCLLSSCSVKKYLQPGEAFYNGATVKIIEDSIKVKNSKLLRAELKNLLRPKPNKKFLGRRNKVWFYYVAGETEKEKGFRHWLKYKLGEPPVLMNDVTPERNVVIIKNYLENNGYFFATATGDTVIKKQEGKAHYTATPRHQYSFRNIAFPADTSKAAALIGASSEETFLKGGNPYSFETLKQERLRIDEWMKRRGYYLFNPDYLLMRVDTTIGSHEADLFVTIKRETAPRALLPYEIKNVYVFPNHEPSRDSLKDDSTYWHKKYFVIDPDETYKPEIFDRVISFEPGRIYNKDEHNKTLSRLVNIGTFRFVKNTFEELPNPSDTGLLNAYYYLYSNKKRNLRLETTGSTNSASLAGVELNLNWRNRNLFRGAEQLMLKLFGGFDIQYSGQNKGYNIYNIGAEGSISWPRVFPFNFAPSGPFVPYTKLSISNNWQNRQKLYSVNTLKTSYAWGWRPNLRHEHMLAPFQVTFVDNNNVTQEYLDQIALDSSLARVIEEQLIIGPEYNYIYNNTLNAKKSNGWYYRGNINFSNNILGWVEGADAKNGNVESFLGVQYSQFLRTEQDLRYYRKLSRFNTDRQWVNRINVGFGFPYGNSLQLPYIKQFFTGGANGLRAFRVRSVGPGSFSLDSTASGFIPDLVGDIKLELNSEFRTKLYGMLHGAIFIDAGNVWLFNESPSRPGGEFSKDFLKELAVGAGIGLRFDIAGIFMIRLDTGFPLRKPSLD